MKTTIALLLAVLLLFPSVTTSANYPVEQAKQMQCLVQVVLQEAQGEPLKGIRAVVAVIHNRKQHQQYPSTYCDVVLQNKQFTNADKYVVHEDKEPAKSNLQEYPYKGLEGTYKTLKPEVSTLVYTLSLEAVTGRLKPSLPPDVMWYHSGKPPYWVSSMKKHIRIAGHTFYKKKQGKKKS